MTPTVARRVLYAIVGACVALTAAAALLRPAPKPVSAPQPVAVQQSLPFEVQLGSSSSRVITIPIDGSASRSYGFEVVVPVHGLPGQVGASP